MDFSPRMGLVKPSATFKYAAIAKKPGVINLTVGRPDFDSPAVVKEAAKKALDDGKIHYAPLQGIPELREKIAAKLANENNIQGVDAEKVIVSGGAKMILYEAIMALVGKGDTVAIADPSWVSYEAMIRLAEADVAWLPIKPEKGLKPDDEYLSALEDCGAKVLILNSPSNPTGAVFSESELRKIVDVCERKNIFLISDEPYEKFIYEGEHFSPGSVYENTLTVNAFSKSYSMTGWRVGYAGCPDGELIKKMKLIQGQSLSSPTTFAQYGALACFTDEANKAAAEMVAEFKSRRDHVMTLAADLDMVYTKPAGAFYLFPKFGDVDDTVLAEKLIEAGVGTIPGSPFGSVGRGCLRISYGSANKEKLTEAFKRIKNTL